MAKQHSSSFSLGEDDDKLYAGDEDMASTPLFDMCDGEELSTEELEILRASMHGVDRVTAGFDILDAAELGMYPTLPIADRYTLAVLYIL
jgi:hypothetical protein